MKAITLLALLGSTQAARLRDIFDAYDIESKKEAMNKNDTIDPAALTAEIGGDEIAKEVKLATAGVEEGAEQALIQLDDDLNVQTESTLKFIPEEGVFLQMVDSSTIKYELDETANIQDPDLSLDGRAIFVEGPEAAPKKEDEANIDLNSVDMPYGLDRSNNEYDGTYLQTRVSNFVNRIDGPDSLDDVVLLQSQWKRGANRIFDEDGDGIEDNVHKDHFELDEYYYPAVFGVAEDLHNTHDGNLPGHIQKEWEVMQTAPEDHYSLVKHDWVRL
mmetsp:Transcript_9342/g.14118  ORF Transcript_9342/g.14118 Transcript_9342/m.14118 type:complete len:274 (-) Transcript_9342:44-865(-)